jgi:hypothetical protein
MTGPKSHLSPYIAAVLLILALFTIRLMRWLYNRRVINYRATVTSLARHGCSDNGRRDLRTVRDAFQPLPTSGCAVRMSELGQNLPTGGRSSNDRFA